MTIPQKFSWLGTIGDLPKLVVQALRLYGIHEGVGSVNNQVILGWANETGLVHDGYTADSIPWCGLFMALCAQRCNYPSPAHPLWALNWKGFGQEAHQPLLGCVLVFLRNGGGHVGIYIAEDNANYYVLGGNTGDQVAIAPILKKRCVAVREPIYKLGRQPSAKPYIIAPTGQLASTNEA